jgi:hypothetical protein
VEGPKLAGVTGAIGFHAYRQDVSNLTGDDLGIVWSYEPELEVVLSRKLIPTAAMFKMTYTSVTDQTLLVVSSVGSRHRIDLKPGESKSILLDPQQNSELRLKIQSLNPCRSPREKLGLPDDRLICFGIMKDSEGNVAIQAESEEPTEQISLDN